MMVSVLTTVLNEEKHIGELIESLRGQEQPYEFIIVDAKSRDRTVEIIKRHIAEGDDWIRLIEEPGSRGKCFNIGIDAAKGDVVTFIGGDGLASKDWIARIRAAYERNGEKILCGKVILTGYRAFKELDRVELYYKGFDISYPGNNTSYPARALREIDGFDPYFNTAEDIDLNYRAVSLGYEIVMDDDVVIYHKVRDSLSGFIKQAFWNGYGRKQLTIKHGKLWSNYSFRQMIIQEMSIWKFLRLGIASLGYMFCKVTSKVPDFKNPPRQLKTYTGPRKSAG